MRTRRGLDRMTTFADAVVAIAITLLVLPLVDIPSEAAPSSLGDLMRDNRGVLGAFFLSFVVIARLWMGHHQIFERVDRYDPVLVQLTFAWLLTVVFLPFPTELLGQSQGRGVNALYVGTMLASSLALGCTSAWVAAHPGLLLAVDDEGRPIAPERARWGTSLAFAGALAVVLAVPEHGMWALLLLLLATPFDRWVAGRGGKRTTHPGGVPE